MSGSRRFRIAMSMLAIAMLLTTACGPAPTPAALSTALPIPSDPSRAQSSPNSKPALVEFFASWCAACVQMKPVISKLEDEYGHRIDFKIYDVAGSQAEKKHYKYMGQPQYDIVDGKGEIIFIRIGYQNYESLKVDLDTVLARQ